MNELLVVPLKTQSRVKVLTRIVQEQLTQPPPESFSLDGDFPSELINLLKSHVFLHLIKILLFKPKLIDNIFQLLLTYKILRFSLINQSLIIL